MTSLDPRESNYPPSGPVLRYTNERAREMERSVQGFAKLVNDDLYDLLKWAEELRQERDLLRLTLGRLVDLKDGPRDHAYRASKDDAWESARRILEMTERDGHA